MKTDLTNFTSRQVHDVLTGVISPLPVALISTIGEDGVYNAAPFSLVVPISWKPPLVSVAIGSKKGQKKDTLKNIEFSGDFVINIMSDDHTRPALKAAGNYPSNVDEIKEVGLTAAPGDKVKSPLVREAQASLECRLFQKIELGAGDDIRWIVFGEVVLVHLKDEVWVSGEIDPGALKAVGRLGDGVYCRTREIFKP